MATGDTADIVSRLRAALPLGWFPSPPGPGEAETAPVLAGLLTGIATPLAAIYALLGQVRLQMRLATSTGSNVDLTAIDYFGPGGLPRRPGEDDLQYRLRIKASRFPDRNTRGAVIAAETLVIGSAPVVIEPMRAADTKGWGSTAAPAAGGGFGYGCAGLRWGSPNYPEQFFVEAPAGAEAGPVDTAAQATRPVAAVAWVRVL